VSGGVGGKGGTFDAPEDVALPALKKQLFALAMDDGAGCCDFAAQAGRREGMAAKSHQRCDDVALL
jgi:hypothetical protein